ncbi:sulfotransferase domain-containing protein [Patescibacteria group bacterium]|nr:sulfotransferase domain-containing protein [Patescibacteria group bacterium]
MRQQPLHVYFGHHKCATQWTESILRKICSLLTWNYAKINQIEKPVSNIKKYITTNAIDFLAYENPTIDVLQKIPSFKGFVTVRDPRDICVSAYFSHVNSHPVMDCWQQHKKLKEQLGKVSFEEGLLLEMAFPFTKNLFSIMRDWPYELPYIRTVKMEDLIHDPYQEIIELFQFLNIADTNTSTHKEFIRALKKILNISKKRSKYNTLSIENLLEIVYQNRFSKLSGGRKRGEEDQFHHYRKGISGDWKNYFNEVHKKKFKAEFNDVLLALDYEHDDSW